ncbi:MAG: hypothetical protein HEP71_16560 [Roseivirga sp.]|nr:hypothetical protein [Roseivirga sp.]
MYRFFQLSFCTFLLLSFLSFTVAAQSKVTDRNLNWPSAIKGSTHELAMHGEYIYITGQNMHHVAKMSYGGSIEYFAMPEGSGPHGIVFDKKGRLWVSLEFKGVVVRLDERGKIVEEISTHITGPGISTPINTSPHGLGLDADGKTIWFTGKRTSTVGKISPNGKVQHFELPSLGGVPIYLHAGPDGNMWGTELLTSKILHVTPKGKVTEFIIPTTNSRPIAIKPDPTGDYMWFTEEAGNKVGRIDMQGNIDEFAVPATQTNQILAGLTFDSQGNLWVQSYVDQNNPLPEGNDYIIKFDKSILRAPAGDLSNVEITYYKVPTAKTVMHRIKEGKDGNIYFTELKQDKLGKVTVATPIEKGKG